MEQHLQQAREEEEILMAINKKDREDVLKAISEVRNYPVQEEIDRL